MLKIVDKAGKILYEIDDDGKMTVVEEKKKPSGRPKKSKEGETEQEDEQ